MSERLVGVSFSLLKYDNPVLVREPSADSRKRVRHPDLIVFLVPSTKILEDECSKVLKFITIYSNKYVGRFAAIAIYYRVWWRNNQPFRHRPGARSRTAFASRRKQKSQWSSTGSPGCHQRHSSAKRVDRGRSNLAPVGTDGGIRLRRPVSWLFPLLLYSITRSRAHRLRD